ncbi:hypothetical protein H4S08_001823 [Coemansia sp. RSA 1365]|nr:hypothetical protein H4S08_001823 [Coemansia sp. RSA 1365]
MDTNNTTEEAVRSRLVELVGNSPLRSSEDLVQSQQAPSVDYNSPLRDSRYSGSHLRAGPTNVGSDDLDPMGLMRGNSGEGSMLVGPDHPMFTQGGERSGDDGSALPGGPPQLPRDAVPPGARFDPIIPPGAMPPGPGRGRGSGRGGGAGGNRFFSGDPDPDAGGPPDSSWNYM